jgi:hypothetical protein
VEALPGRSPTPMIALLAIVNKCVQCVTRSALADEDIRSRRDYLIEPKNRSAWRSDSASVAARTAFT